MSSFLCSSPLSSLPHFEPSHALILCTLKTFFQGKFPVLHVASLHTWEPLVSSGTLRMKPTDSHTHSFRIAHRPCLPESSPKVLLCVKMHLPLHFMPSGHLLFQPFYHMTYFLIEDFGTGFTVSLTQVVPSSLTISAHVGWSALSKSFHFPSLLRSATPCITVL